LRTSVSIPGSVLLVSAWLICARASSGQTDAGLPLKACAAPALDTSGWHRVTASIGPVELLIPSTLREWHYARQSSFSTQPGLHLPRVLPVAVQFWKSSDREQDIDIRRYEWAADSSPPPWLPDQRAIDVTECADTVDDRPLLIRSYRSSGMIIRNGTPMFGYVVEAALRLGPTVRIVISGAHQSPDLQRQTLVIIRSLRIRTP